MTRDAKPLPSCRERPPEKGLQRASSSVPPVRSGGRPNRCQESEVYLLAARQPRRPASVLRNGAGRVSNEGRRPSKRERIDIRGVRIRHSWAPSRHRNAARCHRKAARRHRNAARCYRKAARRHRKAARCHRKDARRHRNAERCHRNGGAIPSKASGDAAVKVVRSFAWHPRPFAWHRASFA
jgi:hypothetical protein